MAVVIALGVVAAAIAAPAPKTTGGIGFKAYSDVQRYVDFSAIQTTGTTCGTFWDVTGINTFTFHVSPDTAGYTHDVTLTQSGESITGVGGGYPAGADPYSYWWHVTSGSVVGNAFTLTWVYDGAPDATGTVTHMSGTIASDGTLSGTWNDNYLGGFRSGTFTAGGAASGTQYCGKGTAYYYDDAGNWYFANVTNVSVQAPSAWFAARVIAASNPDWLANDLFAKTTDLGEPGIDVDQYWGSFATPTAAVAGVSTHSDPGDGPFTINLGNLQVH